MNEINKYSDELFLIEKGNELQVLSKIDFLIIDIKNKIQPLVSDVNTAKGRKEIISNAFKITKTKTTLISLIDDLIEQKESEIKPTLDIIFDLKKNKKKVNADLTDFSNEIRGSVTEWENKEKQRIKSHKENINNIIEYRNKLGSSDFIKSLIKELIEMQISSGTHEEFELEALKSKSSSIEELQKKLSDQLIKEKEQEELIRLRKEAQERELKEKEQRVIKETEERLKNQHILIQKQLEKEKQDAIIKEQESERKRIESEAHAKIKIEMAIKKAKEEEIIKQEQADIELRLEKEKREKNELHVKYIINNIKLQLIDALNIEEELALRLITIIDAGIIDNLSINY